MSRTYIKWDLETFFIYVFEDSRIWFNQHEVKYEKNAVHYYKNNEYHPVDKNCAWKHYDEIKWRYKYYFEA